MQMGKNKYKFIAIMLLMVALFVSASACSKEKSDSTSKNGDNPRIIAQSFYDDYLSGNIQKCHKMFTYSDKTAEQDFLKLLNNYYDSYVEYSKLNDIKDCKVVYLFTTYYVPENYDNLEKLPEYESADIQQSGDDKVWATVYFDYKVTYIDGTELQFSGASITMSYENGSWVMKTYGLHTLPGAGGIISFY